MKTGLVSKAVATACLGLALQSAPSWAADTSPETLSVVYWGAGDCGPCALWSKTERKQEFLAEAKALGVRLVEVQRPRVADPLSHYRWPKEDTALMRSYAKHQYKPSPLTPAFDFVCRGELALRLEGLADWDSFWKRSLRQQVKQCQASSG
ncbi:hypothetical protein ACG0Z6_06750 [Roseateles sp. BYS180W]|uniref:Thioredoxin family protein n=1 Tax=Roseateles rivi TaxID=3299028 RepID=A0ABW7FUE0_9BURK